MKLLFLIIRILLFPFSLLFGIITCARNCLYDWKLLPSAQYTNILVISVGNITVGGTGKTPFVEYLIRTLSQNYKLAVLSRGYGRTTTGFLYINSLITPAEAGDEPYQISRKFPDVVVAVDADRVNGIARIRKDSPDVQIILLDDALQYRQIHPGLSILLADYSKPLYQDSMLPGGRLREWSFFAARADVMIVTKVPNTIEPSKLHKTEQRYARIFPRSILFTKIKYGEPQSVFANAKTLPADELIQCNVLLITGIANPRPLETYIRQRAASTYAIHFPDHHAFSDKNIALITKKWNAIPAARKILLTTEKDAVRLQQAKFPETLATCSYFLPIEIEFINGGKRRFNELLHATYSER